MLVKNAEYKPFAYFNDTYPDSNKSKIWVHHLSDDIPKVIKLSAAVPIFLSLLVCIIYQILLFMQTYELSRRVLAFFH